MPRAPHKCTEPGCPQLIPAGAGAKCPDHRRESAGKFGSVRNSRARTSTAGHRARRQSTLRQAGGQCQIRYDGICADAATVFDHIISLKMHGLLPAAIRARVTVDMLDTAPWNRQASCEPCSRRKTSIEGHYVAGHDVPRPYDLDVIPKHVRDGAPASSVGIPRPITLRYNTTNDTDNDTGNAG
jgi:5-methylcytosine-specific restriction endonuclease McrA